MIEEDTKHKILNIVRNKLRPITSRKAATRQEDMVGLEDLSSEKSRAIRKKKTLDRHLLRSLEYVISNAVLSQERKFRLTEDEFIRNARSGKIS